MNEKAKSYAALYLLLIFLSLGSVLIKLASGHAFLSPEFILLYGGSLSISVVYALGWQQVLKRLPLTVAYANRALTVVLGMIWGYVIFGESITLNMLLGSAVILAGIILLVRCDEQ